MANSEYEHFDRFKLVSPLVNSPITIFFKVSRQDDLGMRLCKHIGWLALPNKMLVAEAPNLMTPAYPMIHHIECLAFCRCTGMRIVDRVAVESKKPDARNIDDVDVVDDDALPPILPSDSGNYNDDDDAPLLQVPRDSSRRSRGVPATMRSSTWRRNS